MFFVACTGGFVSNVTHMNGSTQVETHRNPKLAFPFDTYAEATKTMQRVRPLGGWVTLVPHACLQ